MVLILGLEPLLCAPPVNILLGANDRLPPRYDLGAITHMDRTQLILLYEAGPLNGIQVRY